MNKVGAPRLHPLWWITVALVVAVCGVVALRHARSVSTQNSMGLLRSSNRSLASSLDRHTKSLVQRVVSLANDPGSLAYVQSPDEPVARIMSQLANQDISEKWQVVDRKGNCLFPKNQSDLISIDWGKLDSGEPSMRFFRSSGDHSLAMIASPIMDGPRAIGGVVLTVDLGIVFRDMGLGRQPGNAMHSIVSATGETLVGSPASATPAIAITKMTESIRQRSSGENSDGYLNGNGEVVLGAWEFLPEWNVGVATEYSRHGASAGVRFIEQFVAGLVMAGLLGGLLFIGVRHIRQKNEKRPADDHAPSRSFGNYQLGEALGRGGMGTVYRARHIGLRRDVAVKVLESHSHSELAVTRFEREVQLTAKLQHPNTIAVYDYGRSDDGAFFYAMELIDGLTLQQLIDGFGAQSPERVIHLLLQVCGSLAEAHGMGLIHRDVKPANILVSRGVGTGDLVKVLDFGLVKDIRSESETSLTRSDSITGTPMYMSPEAVRDAGRTNTQSDLYSIAAVGYSLLAGRPMFQGETSVEICMRQMKDQPMMPEERLGCPLPRDLQKAIMTGLRKDPADRWLSVEDFATALSRCRDAGKWGLADSESWWSMAGQKEIPRNKDPQFDTVAQKTLT